MKKKKSLIIKLIIGLVIFGLILLKIDLETCKTVIKNVSLYGFISIVLLYILGQVISTYKWMIISNQLGFNRDFKNYIIYYFKGMFYNQFLPTSIGGDIMKVIYLAKTKDEHQKYELAIVSVLFDRISGVNLMVGLMFLGIIMCVDYLNKILLNTISSIIIITIIGITAVLIAAKSNKEINNKILSKCIFYTKALLNKSIIKIFALSLLFHIIVLIIHFIIGQDLALNIPLKYYLILYPLSALISSIPISLNGMGLREFAYVYILSIIAINPSQCIIFVLYWNCAVLISSLLGALSFINFQKKDTNQ